MKVVCIDNNSGVNVHQYLLPKLFPSGSSKVKLTLGNAYDVITEWMVDYTIIDDNGNKAVVLKKHFIKLREHNLNKLV